MTAGTVYLTNLLSGVWSISTRAGDSIGVSLCTRWKACNEGSIGRVKCMAVCLKTRYLFPSRSLFILKTPILWSQLYHAYSPNIRHGLWGVFNIRGMGFTGMNNRSNSPSTDAGRRAPPLGPPGDFFILRLFGWVVLADGIVLKAKYMGVWNGLWELWG